MTGSLDIHELEGLKFPIGQPLVTRGVHELIGEDASFAKFVGSSFVRHCHGDWGDLGKGDKQMNEDALVNGERIFSKYKYNKDISIYIITEWDRSYTTILFPEEY